MNRKVMSALLALALCLSGCQSASTPPPEASSAPGGTSAPAASAPQEEIPAPEPVRYQLAPVPDEAGLYQVVSSEEDGGLYELTPAQGEEALYRVEADPENVECFQVVPAPEDDELYESDAASEDVALYVITDAQEKKYYRVQKSASRNAEPVFYVADSVRLPTLTQEDLDQVLAEAAAQHPDTAVSVAVIEDGRVTRSGTRGWAVKDRRELTADTKVRVASLTKVVMGMGAVAMVEDGVLKLDAPLREYWGQAAVVPYSEPQPSPRTLLSHTSGLQSRDVASGMNYLRSILSDPDSWRRFEPGDGGYWHYNNFGYCVLGATMELASGRLLEDYLQQRLFQPLDIRASLCTGALEAEELTDLYNIYGDVQRSAEEQAGVRIPTKAGQVVNYCAGGLAISAVDLAKLVSVLAGDGVYTGEKYQVRLLDAGTVEAMEEPQFTVAQDGSYPFQQCLTLRRQENLLGRPSLYYHTGSAYGAYNMLSYDPDTGDGVVVLTVGGSSEKNDRGLYALAADLSADLYARMEERS